MISSKYDMAIMVVGICMVLTLLMISLVDLGDIEMLEQGTNATTGYSNTTTSSEGRSGQITVVMPLGSSERTVPAGYYIVGILTSEGAVVAYIATGIGAIISIITYRAAEKRFRLSSLAEAFRLLNEREHREARKVIYEKATPASYEILGLARPIAEGETTSEELMTLCRDIVRSDFNEIGTLVHYNLLDGKIFVGEYYWVILKIWQSLEEKIRERRKTVGPPNYMEHLEEMRNKALEYAKDNFKGVYLQFLKSKDKPADNGKR